MNVGPGEVMIAMSILGCGTAVALYAIYAIFKPGGRPGRQEQQALLEEIRGLREEMRALKQQNTDVILSLDSAVHHADRRLSHLEQRSGAGAGESRELEVRSR